MRSRRKKSLFSPLRQNLSQRLSNSDNRIRRILSRVLLVFILAFLAYSCFDNTYGFIRIAKLHMKKNQMLRENHQILVKLIDADLSRKRLTDDLNYIEFIARSQHYLTRPGEVIYRFKE
jgi:cell division protein FtsB